MVVVSAPPELPSSSRRARVPVAVLAVLAVVAALVAGTALVVSRSDGGQSAGAGEGGDENAEHDRQHAAQRQQPLPLDLLSQAHGCDDRHDPAGHRPAGDENQQSEGGGGRDGLIGGPGDDLGLLAGLLALAFRWRRRRGM